ncbi:FAD-binding oxidoreductase [Candidatus Methylospira mobilis]|uniref:FAD-binding oxidoreductase n=1 Tax=Candidatus Methylospira mobilis TaxID=1808979 RepID=A0A5Q0BGV9_9GAMM|nr:FAD-binding oxidoreductase [Candidatus Methylospira mobilis]QFY41404.1 FAD-binding oxidoreductase [Candidatus Methylospira mobilis]
MRRVSSWGRLNADLHHVVGLNDRDRVSSVLAAHGIGIAHGMGRSYGDACMNPEGVIWHTTGLDRFIRFDEQSGLLACEAGLLLRDIQRLVIPRGWILPVTPGTQLVTVGGAIANDVHGKNHHMLGSFGDHLRRIRLVRTDGNVIECSPQLRADWFAATVGGLGLTGVIVEAEIQLRSVAGPWLDIETAPYANLDEFFRLADDSEAEWEHTVSWIDCISGAGERGIFMRGRPADTDDRREPRFHTLRMPLEPPVSLVNRLSLRLFNMAYFHFKKRRAGCAVAHYESFFYPLDNILGWNRMYGPRGFFQYQFVVPREAGQDAVQSTLAEIARSGDGSFLAVLKTFGSRQPVGMMSFPQHGVTLALDFPNNGARTLKLFERLDAIVRGANGRVYLAKDARIPRELFEAGYPLLNDFLKYRDPGISSGLSRRLMGS